MIKIIAGQALEDQCSKKPCQNGGECIQIKYGRYKCDCQGTKYHGEHCEMGNIIHLKIKIQYSLFISISNANHMITFFNYHFRMS